MMKWKHVAKALLTGMLALTLVGCGGSGEKTTAATAAATTAAAQAEATTTAASTETVAPASEEAKRDGIRIAVSRDIKALDGFTGNNVSYGLAYQIFDTLVQLNEDASLRPGLATEWEQVDDYTWRFKLREGVTFTNGEPFNAESAAYSVNYKASLDTKYQNYKQWGESWPPSAEVEDEYTILIKTQKPNLAVPALLTRGAMIPMEASKSEEFWKNPIGSGSYKLAKWDVGVQVVLEANEDYWGGAPQIKTLTYDIISDTTARAAAVKSGEYDFVENVPFDTALELAENPTNLELVRTDLTGMWYVYFNGYANNPVIKNKGIRQAMQYAIDHQGIVDAIMGGLVNSAQNVTPLTIKGTYDAGGYPEYNPEKAMEMAKAAGYNGEEIIVAYGGTAFNNDLEILELITAQLMEAGFNIKFEEYDDATFDTLKKSGEGVDISVNGYGGTYTGDSEQYYTQGARNIGWNWDEAEGILGKIYGEGITAEAREEYLKELVGVIWDESPYLFATEATGLWGIAPDLKGYEILMHGQFSFPKAYIE